MHQVMPPPIEALLRPRAIALVGVSAKGGAGANILRSGERFGYTVAYHGLWTDRSIATCRRRRTA